MSNANLNANRDVVRNSCIVGRSALALAVLAGAAVWESAASAALVSTVTVPSLQTPVADGTVSSGEYGGSFAAGGGGFGGPIGSSTLSVTNDASRVYFALSGLGNYSGNSIRIYIDSKSGGYNTLSGAAGFNDFADFGRERLSRPASGGVTLPFDADFGWILSPAFGGFGVLFQLVPGGNGSLVYQSGATNTPVGENPTKPTVEFSVDFATLGISPGDSLNLVLLYANNNNNAGAFLSNEGVPFQFSGNPGSGPVVVNDYVSVQTAAVPEASSLAVVPVALLLGRRRREVGA